MKLPRFLIQLPFFVGTAFTLVATPEPDFVLPDTSASSPRFQQTISPRQYQERISAYYFGYEW